MKLSELMQKAYLLPAVKCAGLGLVLFLAAWWRERRGGSFALVVLGLAWVVLHLAVNANSYRFPPPEAGDWMVFASLGLALAAAGGGVVKSGEGAVAVIAGLLLGVAAWLALHKLPWLMDREETAMQRHLWTGGIMAAVLAAFAFAEMAARKAPAAAMSGGLAIFAALAGAALLQLAMPERITARLLAAAGLAGGATAAVWIVQAIRPRPGMKLSPGVAGWMAGGGVLLFILGCLSRASGVPLMPMAAAVAALPVTALAVRTGSRFGKPGVIAVVILTLAGAVLVWTSLKGQETPVATGADDTGAYEGY